MFEWTADHIVEFVSTGLGIIGVVIAFHFNKLPKNNFGVLVKVLLALDLIMNFFHFSNDIGYDVFTDNSIKHYFVQPCGLLYGFSFRLSAFLTLAIAIVAYYIIMSDFNVPYRIILLMALPPLGFLIYDWYNYYTNAEYFVFWTVEIVVLWIVFIAMVTLYSLCLVAINPRIKKDQTPKSLIAMYRFMLLFSVVNIIIWLPFLLSDTYFVYIVQSTKSFPGPFYFTYVHPFFSASINMKGFFHAIVIYFGTCQTPTKQSTPKIEPESTTLPFAMPKLDVSDATAHDSGQGSSFDVLSVDQLLEHQVFNHSNLDILNSDKPTLTSSRYPSVVIDVGNSVKIPTGELGESYVQPQNEPASYTPSLALGDSVIF